MSLFMNTEYIRPVESMKKLIGSMSSLFESKRVPNQSMRKATHLYAKLGQLNMELDWFKKQGIDL